MSKIKQFSDCQISESLLEHTNNLVVITDAEHKVVFANKAAERITGHKERSMLGKNPKQLWGGWMNESFYKKVWNEIKGKGRFSEEITNQRKSGSDFVLSVIIFPVIKNKKIKYYIEIGNDITHEKELEQSKVEFISIASHQLRTPLSAIKWSLDSLLEGDLGKMNKGQLKEVKEAYHSNERMIEMVNALLNVSRIEFGTFVIDPEFVNLSKLIESVLKEVKHVIQRKKLTIVRDYNKKMPDYKVDFHLMRIVLQNLINNAVKYTPKGGQVGVLIKRGKKYLKIEVSDTGCGIPEEQKDKVFSKLFRARNVRELTSEGTGLGLYIVKMVVDSAGGTISFRSKENEGTTFIIDLPIKGIKKKQGNRDLISEGLIR